MAGSRTKPGANRGDAPKGVAPPPAPPAAPPAVPAAPDERVTPRVPVPLLPPADLAALDDLSDEHDPDEPTHPGLDVEAREAAHSLERTQDRTNTRASNILDLLKRRRGPAR